MLETGNTLKEIRGTMSLSAAVYMHQRSTKLRGDVSCALCMWFKVGVTL